MTPSSPGDTALANAMEANRIAAGNAARIRELEQRIDALEHNLAQVFRRLDSHVSHRL